MNPLTVVRMSMNWTKFVETTSKEFLLPTGDNYKYDLRGQLFTGSWFLWTKVKLQEGIREVWIVASIYL